MEKRGQGIFGISFGALFSIFIIIAILAVGFFVIRSLLDVNDCAEIGLFKKELQAQIDDAWASGSVDKNWPSSDTVKFPNDLEAICFGTLSLPVDGTNNYFYSKIVPLNTPSEANIYFYPPEICKDLFYNELEKVHFNNFFCINATNGKLEDPIKLRYNDRNDLFLNISSS